MACNLFSVRAAATKGNTVKIGNTRCWIHDRNRKLLGMGSLVDKLYYLDYKTITREDVATASGSRVGNKADLWHQQLGHLNEYQLKKIVSQKLVKGVEIPKSMGYHSVRSVWKERCLANLSSQWEKLVFSTRRLQCVHSDVCGPMPTNSIGRRR